MLLKGVGVPLKLFFASDEAKCHIIGWQVVKGCMETLRLIFDVCHLDPLDFNLEQLTMDPSGDPEAGCKFITF